MMDCWISPPTLHRGPRLTPPARRVPGLYFIGEVVDVTGHLGPEPFDPAFTPEVLHANLHQRRRQMKALLLDQGGSQPDEQTIRLKEAADVTF